jgi:uncharacterized membrane protein
MVSASKAERAGDDRHLFFRLPTLAVVALMLAAILTFGALSLLRYAGVRDNVDLAGYSQAVWNTAHGEPFRTSVLPFTENYLGNHFTPILALFAPLYLLWPDPRILQLAQVVAGCLAILPLYWFARERLPTPWPGVLLAAAYLAYPAFLHQILTDFHGVTLGAAVVMWAFFALLTRRDLLLLCLLPVMFLIREDLSLVIFLMGLYAIIFQRRWRLGLVLSAVGLAASALVILVLIPAFRGGREFHYGEYYAYLGGSPLEMARTLLLQPQAWLPRALFRPKLELLVQLLLPVAFLPLLAPSVFLLGASALAYLLLVDYPFHQIYILDGHYQALLVPFIFYGTVLGIARLVEWLGPRWGERRGALAACCVVLVLCLVTAGLWSPLADEARRAEFRVDEQSRAEQALLSRIPPDAGVVADDRFAAALSTRQGFYLFGGLFEYPYPIDYLIFEDTPTGYPAHPPALLGVPYEEGWQVPRWELLGSAGLTKLWHRIGTVLAAPLEEPPTFGGMVALRGAPGYRQPVTSRPGGQLPVALVWESRAEDLPRLVPFVQLVERRDGVEHRWASVDREPYGGLFPTDRWWPQSLVGDIYPLHVPPWLPPGAYELQAGLYTREGQQRLVLHDGRTTALAGTVQVTAPELPAADQLPQVPVQIGQPLAEGLALYGQNPILELASAGGEVDITLYWQATASMEKDYEARFDLVAGGEDNSGSGAAPTASWRRPLVASDYPATQWQAGSVVAGWYPLAIPPDLAPGRYDLLVTAVDGAGSAGQPVRLATLEIVPAE